MNRYVLSLLFFTAFFITGCAQCPECGRITNSVDVAKEIRLGEMNPDYNYYLYWRGGFAPVAIVGLDKRYTVESEFWKPASPTEKEWQSWAQEYNTTRGYYDDYYGTNMYYRGYTISRPDGMQAGIYYSALKQVRIRFLEDDTVEVSVPYPSSQQLVLHGMSRR